MAEEYERVRSGYPAALLDKACATLRLGNAVVEIGPGTGKLTRLLVERGLAVEAIEPDADLIEVARRLVPEGPVHFHIGTFEEVELPPAAFRAVFAATSYHWIDPAVGWRKVASLLEPGGVFALLSHIGGIQGEMDVELVHVWRDVSPEAYLEPIDDETLWAGVEERTGNVSELWAWLTRHELARAEAASLFRDVEMTREQMERELSIEDYLARIRTTNSYLHLEPDQQERLEHGLAYVIDRHGGTYPAKGSAVLVTARRA